MTFNQVVWGSNPQCLMRLKHPESQILCGFPGVLFMAFQTDIIKKNCMIGKSACYRSNTGFICRIGSP